MNNTGGQRRIMPMLVISLSMLVLTLDQISKIAVLRWLQPGEQAPVVSGLFNLVLTYNKGIAFGLISDWSDEFRVAMLVAAAIGAFSMLIYLLLHDYRHDILGQVAIAFVLGGALGNIADRIRLGHVVDFLDFYYAGWHWPAFNLADSAVCLGVMMLILRPGRRRNDSD